MTRSTRSTVATGRTSCSRPRIRRTRRRRPRRRRRSVCFVGSVPGAAADIAAALRRLHSEPARQPTGIEGCWDHYRRDDSRGNARSADERRTLRTAAGSCTRQRRASGGRHRRTSRTIPRRGSGTCCHSSSRAQRCSAPTGRTRSPVPTTRRTSTRSRRLGSLTSTTRTADETDAAIFWQDHAMALWNRIFRTLAASQGLGHRREALVCSRWRTWLRLTPRSAAGTTSTTGSSGVRSRRSARPTPTATRRPRPIRHGCRCSTQRHRSATHRRSSRRPSPTTPRGTPARPAAFVHTLKNFFGTDRIGFSAFSNKSCTTRSFNRFSHALEGGHRRPSVGRHPLPHRRHAGSRARQEGRPLPQEALLPAGPATLGD